MIFLNISIIDNLKIIFIGETKGHPVTQSATSKWEEKIASKIV